MSAEFARLLIKEYEVRIKELREEKYNDSSVLIRMLHIQINALKSVMEQMGHIL